MAGGTLAGAPWGNLGEPIGLAATAARCSGGSHQNEATGSKILSGMRQQDRARRKRQATEQKWLQKRSLR